MELRATKFRAYPVWADAPKHLLRDQALTAKEKLLIIQLLDWGSMHGGTVCRASNRAIAAAIGVHHDSIARLVRSIRAKHEANLTGWSVVRQFQFGAANKFKVLVPSPEWEPRPQYLKFVAEPETGRKPTPPQAADPQLPLFEPPAATLHMTPASSPPRPAAPAATPAAAAGMRITPDRPAARLHAATAAVVLTPPAVFDSSTQPPRHRTKPDPAAGTIFSRPRFNLLEYAAGKDPAAAVIQAHTAELFSWIRVHGRKRLVLSVKSSGQDLWLHLCTNHPGQTEPLRVPLTALGRMELS